MLIRYHGTTAIKVLYKKKNIPVRDAGVLARFWCLLPRGCVVDDASTGDQKGRADSSEQHNKTKARVDSRHTAWLSIIPHSQGPSTQHAVGYT